ncbi:MAG: hypothetical protein H7240_02040 [Glaciimonas sp.]|nr:hypothetical protein [Glaciimonas sp.]
MGQRPRGLYIVPDFSNPTGTTLSTEDRKTLLLIGSTEDFWLLEDNLYDFPHNPILIINPL